ncbi:MAG: isochorismate pyruvate lyase [Bryobacterales bacterium]|nr:isochorismate pyruvate lyase [Bryobacterales bacterium]
MKDQISPEQCAGLEEIRAGMDAVDREIVALIARRVGYVRAAAKFKTNSANVAAPERVAAVLKTRREWAEAAGLNGDVIEGLYRDLVAYSVSEEHKKWEELNGSAAPHRVNSGTLPHG